MRIVRTIDELRGVLEPRRREGARVGLVPTMGYFHEGHLSLMRRAREACDVVVVSLFVNPTQFNDPADLDAPVSTSSSRRRRARCTGAMPRRPSSSAA